MNRGLMRHNPRSWKEEGKNEPGMNHERAPRREFGLAGPGREGGGVVFLQIVGRHLFPRRRPSGS